MVTLTPRPRRPLPERPVLIQSGDLVLEGLYIEKKSEEFPAVISSPLPSSGGSMDSPFINELAYALARENVPSVRYNYRGVGASQGTFSNGTHELEDLKAAAEFLRETVYHERHGAYVAAGYSFGSWLSFRLAVERDPLLKRVLLVAPPVNKYDFSALTKIKIPVGILVGDKDSFCPIADLEALIHRLAQANPEWRQPELAIIPQASHYFVQGLSKAGQQGAQFLRTGTFGGDENEVESA